MTDTAITEIPSTTDHYATATTSGRYATAITTGIASWASAGPEGTIVLAHIDEAAGRTRILVAYPGETEGIEPGIYHHVVDGKIVGDPDMLLPNDGRGYSLRHNDGLYLAGCREFTAEQALAHWSDPSHYSPKSAALLLAAVKAHMAQIAAA